jgi:competence protein ComEC
MPKPFDIPVWKKAPFIRLLLPLASGIVLQWYQQFTAAAGIIGIICFTIAYLLFFLLPISVRFKLRLLQGAVLHLLLICIGLLITWQKDVQHSSNWFGRYYQDSDYLVVRINEPLIEKSKSYKADGYVESVVRNDSVFSTAGSILLYFSKDSLPPPLKYGDKILLSKNLQPIKNSGNPGAFNYQRYAAFQSVFHNVFLKQKDWVKLGEKNINPFKQFIFTSREQILSVLQKNIPADKDELGIAEALLIGYTNDLDKDLVQAYSNTGVVHIIAISGMHLGLIYIMLVFLFAKIPFINTSKIIQVVLILSCLWLFSLLTGAAASVLRSAVMFTFIATGRAFSRESSIYNALAASAFVMLCYNPYFLWDVGFQLSYLAVIGIIIFQKPIYNLLYIKNKWINKVWKLMAISLAAQVFTFPICIYYFHQFPNLFLITNIIAVPLSTVILFAEIALVVFSWISLAGAYIGKMVAALVWCMNRVIVWISHLSFAVWDNIPSTIATTWLLYAVVLCTGIWLLNKNVKAFRFALICIAGFVILHAYSKWQIKNQQQIIVYNVPKHRAIDFITGNQYRFLGDSILLEDAVLQNFHLKPARIALQLTDRTDNMPGLFEQRLFFEFGNKKILVIDKPLQFDLLRQKVELDMIIISKNPRIYINELANTFKCHQYVFDASNSMWKINQWQKECKALNLNFHSIPYDGAFVYAVGM